MSTIVGEIMMQYLPFTRAVPGVGLCLVLAGLLVTPDGHAEQRAPNASLHVARAQVEALDYSRAIETAEALLRRGGSSPEVLHAVYDLLGRSLAAVGRSGEAKRYWRRLLALDPGYRIDQSVSPKIRRPLTDVLADWAGRPGLTATHRAPQRHSPRMPLRLLVEVIEDPLEMVRRLRLFYRLPGVAKEAQLVGNERHGRDIAVVLPLPALGAQAGVLRYHVELLDGRGNILRRLGSAAQPLRVSLSPYPATSDARVVGQSAPWYRRWWVWTLAGAVVAGATAAAVIAATSSPDTSDLRIGYSVRQ